MWQMRGCIGECGEGACCVGEKREEWQGDYRVGVAQSEGVQGKGCVE